MQRVERMQSVNGMLRFKSCDFNTDAFNLATTKSGETGDAVGAESITNFEQRTQYDTLGQYMYEDHSLDGEILVLYSFGL